MFDSSTGVQSARENGKEKPDTADEEHRQVEVQGLRQAQAKHHVVQGRQDHAGERSGLGGL